MLTASLKKTQYSVIAVDTFYREGIVNCGIRTVFLLVLNEATIFVLLVLDWS